MNRAFLQKVLHRLFALFISLAGSFTLIFFIRDALPPGFTKDLTITTLFIIGIDIISILADDLFVSEKATGVTYLRYFVYINIILALIVKFCKPIVSIGLILIGTNAAVVLTYMVKKMFGFYEIFVEHTSELNGKELASDLAENNWYVSDYINCAKKRIFALSIITLVLGAAVLVLHVVGKPISAALYVSLICFIAAFAVLFIIHTINEHETSFAFIGHNTIFSFRNRILIICILLCLVSLGAGAIISSDTAILKPAYFSWVVKGFSKQDVAPDALEGPASRKSSEEKFEIDEDFYAPHEDTLFTKIMHKIIIALEYLFSTIVIAGILFFLLNTFFGKAWKDFWRNKKLILFFRNVWKKLKQLIHDLRHMKRNKIAYNTVEAASFRDSMKSLLSGARKSKEKRAELDALTKTFMQLVDYAASQNVSFKPHMAPLEFARLLADALSDADVAEQLPAASKAGASLTAGRLFEQALYAKELLTKEERALFEESVAAACR